MNFKPSADPLAEGRKYVRSRWFKEMLHEASNHPRVVQARGRMRSGGLRERVRYWELLAKHLNRPAYFEFKVATILDRLPVGRREDVAEYSKLPRLLLYFQSPEVMASLALLLGWTK